MSQLATTNGSLANTNVHAYVQGVGIDTLQTCLGGVKSAFGHIAAKNNAQAAKDISAVSGACTQLAGGTSTGLVYPFDFPDPAVILVGQTYYAYATNSVAGNIQIIDSTDLSHWTAVGNALPSLPAWASANYTWAPVGGHDRRRLRPLLRGRRGGHGPGVHLGRRPPASPRVRSPTSRRRRSSARSRSGGSIDPASFLDTNGTPYLVWKSGGPGSSKIWSQQLAPVGHVVRPRAPTPPRCWRRTRRWEAGTVEAPELVVTRRSLLPLLLGQRLEQRQLRRRRRHLHGPARVRAATPHRTRSWPAGRAWPGPAASPSSPTRRATSGWRSTPGSPARWGSPTAATSISAALDFSGAVPAVATLGLAPDEPSRSSGASAGRGQRLGPSGDPGRVQVGAHLRRNHSSGPANAGRPPAAAASGRCAASPAP